jgi:N-carbamoyl-L-amino-acid hydrolase
MTRRLLEPALDRALNFSHSLFERIGTRSFDGVGVTRAAYGEGEQAAHDILSEAAINLDLRVEIDAALNLMMTLPGRNAGAPSLIIGSHLDSVPQGGNFDGLAGVLAGFACLAALRESGIVPRMDLTVMALRAEENAWFGANHIGSRAALGLLSADVLDTARRADTDRTLAEHMIEAGCDVHRLRTGHPLLDRTRIQSFLELHIEQGPVLDTIGLPVGIVTGIRGNIRCSEIRCEGSAGHAGVVPREMRHDAVFAVSELVGNLDAFWNELAKRGEDLVMTIGRFVTNSSANVTTIPGEVIFSFDARSHSAQILKEARTAFETFVKSVSARRGVSFKLGPFRSEPPIAMDQKLCATLMFGCKQLNISAKLLASGAGHDAGDFATLGIPSAMIFVRNQNGSHNPHEAMNLADFDVAVRLMHWFIDSSNKESRPI